MIKLSEDSLPHEEPCDDLCETGPLVIGGLSQAPGLCPPGKLTNGEFELFSSFSSIFFLLPVICDLVLAELLVLIVLVLDLELELERECECVLLILQTCLPVLCVSILEFYDDNDVNGRILETGLVEPVDFIELELCSCFCVAVVVVLEPFKPFRLVSFIDILEACEKEDPDAEDPDAEETGVSATPFQKRWAVWPYWLTNGT
jgi:hypothetical protein